MGYPETIKMHITEDMRATIESLATRRRDKIEYMLKQHADGFHPMTDATVYTYQQELYTLNGIIAEARHAGT